MLSRSTYPYAPTWRENWRSLSPGGKRLWVAVLVLSILHIAGIAGWMLFSADYAPETALNKYSMDIMVYTNAARALRAGHTPFVLQPWGTSVMVYHYHPLFALLFAPLVDLPFRWLSAAGVFVIATALNMAWFYWRRVAQTLQLTETAAAFVIWMPAAILYPNWLANLYYWNINGILLLLLALLTLALIQERGGLAVLLALPILLTKPQLLFPFLLPLVLRRWRFLALTLAGLLSAYLAVNIVYLLVVGPDSGLQTLRDHLTFLTNVADHYPWQAQAARLQPPNHAWRSIFFYYFGFQAWVPVAVTLAKLALIVPVAWAVVKAWQVRITLWQPAILNLTRGNG